MEPTLFIILLVASMGIMWGLGLENKFNVILFFLALTAYIHFFVGA